MKDLKVYTVSRNEPSSSLGSIVLLHGYGASGRDLMGLADYPGLSDLNLNWHFIEAPLSPPELAAFGGRAWFNLSMQSFMQSAQSKDFSGFYKLESKEFDQSIEALKQTIWNLNLDQEKKNFVGGFSQGAMVSAHLFFDDLDLWSGAVLMSGAPFQHFKWQKNNNSEKKSVFQSHGHNDPVLPMVCGEDLNKFLKENNTEIKTSWFNGGHEIPMSCLSDLNQFLNDNIKS